MKYWFTHLHRAVVKEVFFSFILRFMALLKGLVKTLEYITALGERRERKKNVPQKIVTTLTFER